MSLFKKIKYRIYLKRDLKKRLNFMDHSKIDLILDFVANVGQYAEKLRDISYAANTGESYANIVYVGKQEIQTKKLDSSFNSFLKPGENIMVKINAGI